MSPAWWLVYLMLAAQANFLIGFLAMVACGLGPTSWDEFARGLSWPRGRRRAGSPSA